MDNITIKVRPDGLESNPSRGDYYGDAGDRFLRTDWTLPFVRGLMERANEPFFAIELSGLRVQSWDALGLLLPQAHRERGAMRHLSDYEDVYTGRSTPSLWPLYVLTTAPEQYHPALHEAQALPELVTLGANELSDCLDLLAESTTFGERISVGRVIQVCMGTGYTRSCLPTDGSAVLEAQFAELSNGDILVLAGYEWFNK